MTIKQHSTITNPVTEAALRVLYKEAGMGRHKSFFGVELLLQRGGGSFSPGSLFPPEALIS